MKNLLIVPVLTGLVACGGGVNEIAPELAQLQLPSPVSTSASPMFKTLVIDGYVEGANVFVDFNFNLIQDEGEPSGVFNSTTYEYEFDSTEFSAITDFTETCGMNRPRVAEVPVGAYDSTRGYVNTAYTMMYFPHENSASKANVTPFTTMLTASINDKLTSNISVADGCGTIANQLASDIKAEVNIFLYNLEQNFDINRMYFYDDFIASSDTTQQAIGEKIVDFLGTLHEIEGVLKDTYNMGFRGMLQDNVISLILSNQAFSDVTFDIQNETDSILTDKHFRYNRAHNFYDLRGNSLGQILDSDSLPIEITMANLQANSRVLISENYEEWGNDTPIVNNYLIHMSIEERIEIDGPNWNKTFIRFLPAPPGEGVEGAIGEGPTLEYSVDEDARNVKRIERSSSVYEGFELQMRNSSNPYFNIDLPLIMSTRYPADLQQIYNDITAIDMTMTGVDGNRYLLYINDSLSIDSGSTSKGYQWVYRFHRNPLNDQENCEQRDFSNYSVILQSFTGVEAFNVCLANL
jgi:hypothetical protein